MVDHRIVFSWSPARLQAKKAVTTKRNLAKSFDEAADNKAKGHKLRKHEKTMNNPAGF